MLVVLEVIRSAPNAGAGVVFALLPCAPLAYHVGWELMVYMKKGNGSSSNLNETVDDSIV
ncbi:hypothetical protein BDZ89DRAFT_1062389 [Hymenopellis radicata]|nr:hypothetical protein BDZ89DRAFT_1062389 [Hymenopellis radicata]